MNKISKIALLFLIWFLFGLSVAEAAELKVGVVNTARVLQEAPQARSSSKKLESEFAPRERKLLESQKKIKEKEERLMRDSAVMSESERRKAERDLLAMKRELKRSQDEFREDLNIRRNEEFGKLQRVISRIIDDLAKEKGFDLILGENVIYATDSIDITKQILERLDKDSSAK